MALACTCAGLLAAKLHALALVRPATSCLAPRRARRPAGIVDAVVFAIRDVMVTRIASCACAVAGLDVASLAVALRPSTDTYPVPTVLELTFGSTAQRHLKRMNVVVVILHISFGGL